MENSNFTVTSSYLVTNRNGVKMRCMFAIKFTSVDTTLIHLDSKHVDLPKWVKTVLLTQFPLALTYVSTETQYLDENFLQQESRNSSSLK